MTKPRRALPCTCACCRPDCSQLIVCALFTLATVVLHDRSPTLHSCFARHHSIFCTLNIGRSLSVIMSFGYITLRSGPTVTSAQCAHVTLLFVNCIVRWLVRSNSLSCFRICCSLASCLNARPAHFRFKPRYIVPQYLTRLDYTSASMLRSAYAAEVAQSSRCYANDLIGIGSPT